MSALTAARNTPKLGPGEVILSHLAIPLKANAKVFSGGIVVQDSTGYGLAASTATGLLCCGIFDPEKAASPSLDNTGGGNGDQVARVAQGVFRVANSGTDPVAQADVGQICYLADDQTITKTDGGATPRSPAGILIAVDSTGAYVSMGLQISRSIEGATTSGAGPVERNIASGALSVVKRSSTLAVTGTVAYSLADGVRMGQRKTIHAETAASTPHGVVTPAHPVGFATLDFTTARGTAELEWNGAGWVIVGIGGTVAIA